MNKIIAALVIINTIINLIVVGAFIWRKFGRLSIEWRESFWTKTKHGLDIMVWEFPFGELPNSGYSAWGFNFRPEIDNKTDWARYSKQKAAK